MSLFLVNDGLVENLSFVLGKISLSSWKEYSIDVKIKKGEGNHKKKKWFWTKFVKKYPLCRKP